MVKPIQLETNNNNSIKTENYMSNNKRTIRLAESDLHRVVKESVKRILNEGDKEYNEFIEKTNGLDNSEKFDFIEEHYGKENVYHDLVMWMLNSDSCEDFLKYELEQCAPEKDYWTQVKDIYNSPLVATDD